MKLPIQRNMVSQDVHLLQDGDGAQVTGALSADFEGYFLREGDTASTTLAFAPKDAHGPWAGDSSGNTVYLKELADGLYVFDWPDAMFNSESASWVIVVVKSSTSAFVPLRVQYAITDKRAFSGNPNDFRDSTC